jgi:hypothetical protein
MATVQNKNKQRNQQLNSNSNAGFKPEVKYQKPNMSTSSSTKFATPDNSYRPSSRNSNYSAASPPKCQIAVSPCDSGVSSIESSPNPGGKNTPTQLDSSLAADGTPPVPRDIPFELPKSESKFNVPAPKDPRHMRGSRYALSCMSPFRSPVQFSPYNARSPAAMQAALCSPTTCQSPVSSKFTNNSTNNNQSTSPFPIVTEFKLPTFASSPQVKHRFARLRQISGYKRAFTAENIRREKLNNLKLGHRT